MVFSNLRNGNQLYILHKDNIPKLEIGKIINITPPIPKYTNNMVYNPETILDISVDINGNQTNFQKLNANTEIVDFGNNLVLSCSKEAINNELNSIKQRSTDIVNSIQLHQDIIKNCDIILSQLNPEIQEKQRQEAENKALREEVNSLKEMFKEFMQSCQKSSK